MKILLNMIKEYDQERTKKLESYGLKVLRFWNEDVLLGLGVVEEIIEGKIEEMEKSLKPPLSRGQEKSPKPPLSRGQ